MLVFLSWNSKANHRQQQQNCSSDQTQSRFQIQYPISLKVGTVHVRDERGKARGARLTGVWWSPLQGGRGGSRKLKACTLSTDRGRERSTWSPTWSTNSSDTLNLTKWPHVLDKNFSPVDKHTCWGRSRQRRCRLENLDKTMSTACRRCENKNENMFHWLCPLQCLFLSLSQRA